MSAHDTDILIVGGGMVGASLATALAPLSLKVTVVEAKPPRDAGQPSYDDRSTALSYGSRRIMETLGLWPDLQAAATPINGIHVSDRGHFGATRINHDEQGVPALGYVVENRALGPMLWQAMERSGVETQCPATIADVDVSKDRAEVTVNTTDGDVVYRARLLVVADGARSATRELLGIRAEAIHYGQTAVITNVTPEKFHEHVAYERFTDTGPLAFLPMSNGRCSVVWTLPPQQAETVLALDDAAFLLALQEAFGHRLGRLTRCGSRHSYPLFLVRAERIHGDRHVLVGNAAHGLHPVAGQGFNLGLRDVAALADVIADADDAGAAATLRGYAQWREADHSRVVSLTDGLVRLFTTEFMPVKLARGAGLVALDLLGAPRKAFARQTMGLRGKLPRLARGVRLR
ncbi:MAG: 2-octaprenyl-6-methoxyphenyl hydroxylase [Gammaproteobacteria bacterium]|nr:2-octaprenyl-6-methoxyphenyl hydroxylase [Gammaproteobacteria bacterium]NNF60073.1 2-octaprenyl-6-methoxyphenyl hydroxylase [Gammaproteobacteria bacterium]